MLTWGVLCCVMAASHHGPRFQTLRNMPNPKIQHSHAITQGQILMRKNWRES